jgi:hypothetical protein
MTWNRFHQHLDIILTIFRQHFENISVANFFWRGVVISVINSRLAHDKARKCNLFGTVAQLALFSPS